MGRREQLAVLMVIAVIVFGLGYKYAVVKSRAEMVPAVERAADIVASEITVHVAGAVEKPGVYRLERGSRVADAVTVADPLPTSELNALNLAAVLQDGQKVFVPEKPPLPAGTGNEADMAPPAPPGTGVGGKININTADVGQLQHLPGIGPALADRIVRYRQEHGPFSSVEEIVNVSGIGEKKLEGLQDYATTY
ncbi:MAG: helix-hairpin-helix domain-containing protein [Clostridia bacterium]|nr:helix-hairpin-helix domain-containing protein [Clostridia bacterium]MDQ7792306.1 helix-hairpin-helix domain-containing protein [Clostridia bacterium]